MPHIEHTLMRKTKTRCGEIYRMASYRVGDDVFPDRSRVMRHRHDCMCRSDKSFAAISAQETLFPAFMSITDNMMSATVRASVNDRRFDI